MSANSPVPSLGKLRLRALLLAAQSVFLNVAIFAGSGWYLDTLLDKSPTYFIIGMVLAFVFTNILIIFLAKKFPLHKM